MSDHWWVKVLRVTGIVLMGITAVFTLMGGAGTSCVALSPTGFGGKFSGIAPYQWLYILFVVVTFAFGVMGARAVWLLIRNRSNSYRYAVIALVGGTIVGVIHMLVSRSLRGSSMPVDMVTYTNILTLVVFLILSPSRLVAADWLWAPGAIQTRRDGWWTDRHYRRCNQPDHPVLDGSHPHHWWGELCGCMACTTAGHRVAFSPGRSGYGFVECGII